MGWDGVCVRKVEGWTSISVISVFILSVGKGLFLKLLLFFFFGRGGRDLFIGGGSLVLSRVLFGVWRYH